MKENIARNLIELRGRIAEACDEYDRNADDIDIVAISKTHPAAAIKTAVAAGIHHIGESKVQEAEGKFPELGPIARYHMVGHLQSNKAKKAVELFDVIQSVDSFKLAEEINRHSGDAEREIECLIQVNCSGEEQKYGVAPDDCLHLIKQVHELENIELSGLMTIGPLTDDEDAVRKAFRLCKDLFREGQDLLGGDFWTLSMGMSDDFPLAIAEGSTMIRIGTSLFGQRMAK
jgi:pyridoxal phosphate enzyme (YggS family)